MIGTSPNIVFQPNGTGTNTSVFATQPAANQRVTIPDSGALTTTFVLVDGTQTILGAKNFNNITTTFPTSGGVPTSLSYYEEYNYTTALSGPWTTANNPSITLGFTRIGRMVTCTSANDSSQTATVSANISLVTNFPARFTPSNNTIRFWNFAQSATTGVQSRVDVGTSSGSMAFYNGNGATFAGSGTAGVYKFSFSWSI